MKSRAVHEPNQVELGFGLAWLDLVCERAEGRDPLGVGDFDDSHVAMMVPRGFFFTHI